MLVFLVWAGCMVWGWDTAVVPVVFLGLVAHLQTRKRLALRESILRFHALLEIHPVPTKFSTYKFIHCLDDFPRLGGGDGDPVSSARSFSGKDRKQANKGRTFGIIPSVCFSARHIDMRCIDDRHTTASLATLSRPTGNPPPW